MTSFKNIFVSLLMLLSFVSLSHARSPDVKYNFVSFDSFDPNVEVQEPFTVAASLSVPREDEAVPVVIVVHGSGGVDERGNIYAKALNKVGIATLELDMWAARGLDGGLSRPNHVRETLPDVYGAIKYLQSNEAVQGDNIGLIGFSWGGVVAMLMSNETHDLADNMKGLVANYPVCWAYNIVPDYEFTYVQPGRQLMVIAGEDDLYDGPGDCENLLNSLPPENQDQVSLLELRNATHAFELPREPSEFYDPFAYRGQGGYVPIEFNAFATFKAVTSATLHFKKALNHDSEFVPSKIRAKIHSIFSKQP